MLALQQESSNVIQHGIIPYDHKMAPFFIRNALFQSIPRTTQHIYVIGIGSNSINGDSLGPFVGTLLQHKFPRHLTVLGNLQFPLDASNLVTEYNKICLPQDSFVIAVDSVLGSKNIVQSIVIKEGPVLPGKGLGKQLPSIGDCSIMGVVLEKDSQDHTILFHTNLHLIYTMTINIVRGISLAVRQFFHYPSNYPIFL